MPLTAATHQQPTPAILTEPIGFDPAEIKLIDAVDPGAPPHLPAIFGVAKGAFWLAIPGEIVEEECAVGAAVVAEFDANFGDRLTASFGDAPLQRVVVGWPDHGLWAVDAGQRVLCAVDAQIKLRGHALTVAGVG